MSTRTKKKIILLVLYGLSIAASIFGIIVGSFGQLCCSRKYLGVVVVSVLFFIGSIYGIYYETYVKSAKRKKETKEIKKPIMKIVLWGVVISGSGLGLVLFVIFGAELLDYKLGLFFLIICLISALTLVAIFMLVFNIRRRKKKITSTETPPELEESNIKE